MKAVLVLHNQSFVDIAIQHTGNVENAFLIAKENSLAVSDLLIPGYDLMVEQGAAFNRDIFQFYDAKKIQPSTGWQPNGDISIEKKGIGQMQIGSSFKVYE